MSCLNKNVVSTISGQTESTEAIDTSWETVCGGEKKLPTFHYKPCKKQSVIEKLWIHSSAYSFIGFQTLFIATYWSPIYWNTACLIVESGAVDFDDMSFEDDGESEGSEKQTDYGKVAKALGEIISAGIKVTTPDINLSDYVFKPDVKNNQILFGLKTLSGLNEAAIEKIKANRPYKDFHDFLNKCKLDATTMISLIKAGAFDSLVSRWARDMKTEPRYVAMAIYLKNKNKPKEKLTLANVNHLIEANLIPEEFNEQIYVFNFNRYLKDKCKAGDLYALDERALAFYQKKEYNESLLNINNSVVTISAKEWDRIYKKEMTVIKDWMAANQKELLNSLNFLAFKAEWDKYAAGTISSWEMASTCFYHHEHELAHLDKAKYGVSDFDSLPAEPQVECYFKQNVPIYKLSRIVGTVIGKIDSKSIVTLLTTSGVISVKFSKEQYSRYKKQISEKAENGKKTVIEKSWFKRGTLLMLTGFRRGDSFVVKTYAKTASHQVYQITLNENKKDFSLTHLRKDEEDKNI